MPTVIPTIERTGIIFRPGDYGAKGAYTDADIDAMAGENPLPIRMGHGPTLIEKAGNLGHCKMRWPGFDDLGRKVLFGKWDEPVPLAQLLGDEARRASIEIDLKTRQPVAVALTPTPHIEDAAFFEAVEQAFACFERGEEVKPLAATFAYESISERDAIAPADFADPVNKLFPVRTQSELRECMREVWNAADPTAVKARILEIAQRKGLSVSDWSIWPTPGVSKPIQDSPAIEMFSQGENHMSQAATAPAATAPAAENGKGFFEKLSELIKGAKPEEIAQFTAAPPPAPQEPAEVTELKTRVAAFEAEKEAQRIAGIRAQATAAADKLVADGIIEAKGNETYVQTVAMFSAAAEIDAKVADLACFSAETPAPANFSAVAYLEAVTGKLPKHGHAAGERVGNLDPSAIALFGQDKTTVTDPATGAIEELNKAAADKIIAERETAAKSARR